MKWIKRKTFKRHIDLIRYTVRRAIHRVDRGDPVLEDRLAVLNTDLESETKKDNWLLWAQQKLRGGG